MLTRRQRYELLRTQLENERSSFLPFWRDVGEYILPRRPRFQVTDANKGDRRNQKIIDSTATLAARTLRSGMMSGITSPARPWFRLSTPDPDLAETSAVKNWLYVVGQRMSTMFGRSNLYNSLPVLYGDLGVFGTAAMLVEENVETGLRTFPLAIGSYSIATDDDGKVNVFVRSFRMTVRQLIKKFATRSAGGAIIWNNFSNQVRNLWEKNQTEAWIDVTQVIEPNDEYDSGKFESKYKKFRSCYYERGTSQVGDGSWGDGNDTFLSEKGYDFFPVLAPRWEVTGEDAYATSCPGIDSIGDVRQLQIAEKRSLEAIDKMLRPPLTGPSSLRNSKVSILPGDITYVDERDGQKGFRPTFQVEPRTQELEMKQQSVRARIQRSFYEDLFLMLSQSDRREITAREVDERHEEKLLALGPVLEQLNQDLLDPLIYIAFDIMRRQKALPPAPPELKRVPLRVEYISIMAQAQKAIGLASIERFAGFVGQMVQQTQNPEVLDKVDTDQMIDAYGEGASVPPGIVRSDDKVVSIREQRAKMQQQQHQAEMAQQAAGAAQKLSQTDTSGDNAFTRLLQTANAGSLVPAA